MVIATQNPLEHYGTYPLPESQMDRFLLRLRMGYPAPADERRVVTAAQLERSGRARSSRSSMHADVAAMQDAAARVRVDDALLDYAQRVVAETRESPFLALGVSPRGFQGWYRAAKARALVAGRDYAVPDDFKETALPGARAPPRRSPAAGAATRSAARAKRPSASSNELLERIAVPS